MNRQENIQASVFRPGRLPGLSRLPEEIGREERTCERCGKGTLHILYRVPRKVAFFYVRDHARNVEATCIECAKSTVLTGEDRNRVLENRC